MNELSSEEAAAVQAFKAKLVTHAAASGLTIQQLIALFEQIAPMIQQFAPIIAALIQMLFPAPAPVPTPAPTPIPTATQP